MKISRRIAVWLAVISMLLSLPACGTTEPSTEPPTDPPLTADQVYDAVAAAMSQATATQLSLTLSYRMSLTVGKGENAVTTDAGMDLSMHTKVSREPFGSYTLVDMAMDSGMFNLSYVFESYILEENDSVVSYTQMFDSWTRTDYEMGAEDFLTGGQMPEITTQSVWSGVKPQDLTLDTNTQIVNGKEAYTLRGMIPATDLAGAFSNMGISDPSVLEGLSMPVTYYVDAQRNLILRMEADFDFLNDVLDDILAQTLDTAVEGAAIKLTIPDVVYDLEYDPPYIPAVPQKAYDFIANQEESGDPEPTVSLQLPRLDCGGEIFELRCPTGFTAEYSTENNLSMYNEDYSLVGDYLYSVYYDENEVKNLADINAKYLKSVDLFVSQGEGPAIPGYETWVVIGENQSYYYAWREIGGGLLTISVFDYSGTDDPTILLPQFVGCLFPCSE